MFLDSIFSCCGLRRKDDKDAGSVNGEAATLLPPPREPSILSDLTPGYGATDPLGNHVVNGGLTGEQRARIEEIGREVGNQMLPIHALPSRKPSPSIFKTGPTPNTESEHLTGTGTTSTPSSSRPSSPSPMRRPSDTSMLRSPDRKETSASADGNEDVEVVRKTVFVGGLTAGREGMRRSSGRGRGRGRGRAKS